MPAATSASILFNRFARGAGRFDADAAIRYLEGRGVRTHLEVPQTPEATTAAARTAAERGDDLVFVVGGDGTLRLAAGGLAGSESALAALPGGTANVWVKEAGIPGGFRTAIDAHLSGRRLAMDLGRANEEPFLLMAGIGWDAEIASSVSPRLKRRLGTLAYVVHGLRMLPTLRTTAVEWSVGGSSGQADAALIVASNTRVYGGVLMFAPDARATDGELDIRLFTPRGWGETARLAVEVLARRADSDARVHQLRASCFAVGTPGLLVQVDGDVIGETPTTLTVQRQALHVSVPSGSVAPTLRDAEPIRPRSE